MSVQFIKLRDSAIIPTRGTPSSAGYDLYAVEDAIITPGKGMVKVPTGIAVKIPPGHYGRIAMRSGLAIRNHLIVGAGVIDIDYGGEIGVAVCCVGGDSPVKIVKGDRFAQLVIEKCYYDISEEEQLAAQNAANHAGWGSTGK